MYGALRSFGGLMLNGTLHAKQMNFGSGGILYHGSANIGGSNSISSVKVSSEAYDIPLDVEYEILEQNGDLLIQGKTLPFLDVYVDGKKVDVMGNGSFSSQLANYSNIVSIVARDIFGKDVVRNLNLGLEEIIEEEETEEIPYESIREEDPSLPKGEEVVGQVGVVGEKVVTYQVTYVNGEEVSREVKSEEITIEPVNEIIKVGTKVDESNEGSEGENGTDPEDGDGSDGENGTDPEAGDGSDGESRTNPEEGTHTEMEDNGSNTGTGKNENSSVAGTEVKESETGSNVKIDNGSDNTLPSTATNTFNLTLIGVILLLAGVSIALFRRFKGSRA